jgi:hypothetical protein
MQTTCQYGMINAFFLLFSSDFLFLWLRNRQLGSFSIETIANGKCFDNEKNKNEVLIEHPIFNRLGEF